MSGVDERLPRFDEAVERAMAKWPDVPQCFGWLSLDRRGAWRIRGELIRHPRAVAFLGRHYRRDERGRWYVQNGPQQVFVTLEYTPWIYRYDAAAGFSTHTAVDANALESVWTDDEGNLLVVSDLGVGIVDDRDLGACSALLDTDADDEPRALCWRGARLAIGRVARAEVPRMFGFDPDPAP